MSQWSATQATRVLAALLRIGWRIKRASGSHRVLARDGWPDGTVVTKPVSSAEVLGAFTLEGLHLGIDPVRKTLIPLIVPQV